jgi:hypothetical protein
VTEKSAFPQKVSIQVDGVTVEGLANITPYDLDVHICTPFNYLTGGSSITGYARAHYSFNDGYGVKRSRQILVSLYKVGIFLTDNMESLQGAYAESLQKISLLSEKLNISSFSEDKAVLKKRLRSGDIDNVTYQRLFTPLRKNKKQYEVDEYLITDEFFEDNFPDIVPVGTQEQVIQIIKNPELLFHETDYASKTRSMNE